MDSEKNNQPRKVSFAPQHQVNYICADEQSSTKTSSSVFETPMDLTTELIEFKNLKLFKNPAETANIELDDIFLKNNIIEYQEDPILIKEYEKRSNRKLSLDPFKDSLHDLSKIEEQENNKNAFQDNEAIQENVSNDELLDTGDMNITANINHFTNAKQNSMPN